jgi:hypothetical protein
MASMPFRMMLYVFMGSVPVKGGVPAKRVDVFKGACKKGIGILRVPAKR